VIPSDIGVSTGTFVYNSWRIYLLICAVPSFVVAGLLLFLPESPKFLISKGQHDAALEVFRHIYVMNTGKDAETYQVRDTKMRLPIY
jgi:MFS transporter, VNT family, synaptic vesicle glycoprotein 2